MVHIPGGNYLLPASAPLVLDRPIALEGDGPGRTVLFADEGGTTTAIEIRATYCRIENLSITQNGSPSSGSALGIQIGSEDAILSNITLRHVTVNDMVGGGIKFLDANSLGTTRSTNSSLVEDVLVQGTRSGDHFYVGKGCTTIVLRGCQARPGPEEDPPTGVLGFRIVNAANITLDTCEVAPPDQYTHAVYAMQSGGTSGSAKGANLQILNGDFEQEDTPAEDGVALVRIDGYSNPVVRDCLFFHFAQGLLLEGTYQAIVSGCLFKFIGTDTTPLSDILLRPSSGGDDHKTCVDSLILNNAHEAVDPGSERTPARIDEGGGLSNPPTGTLIANAGSLRPGVATSLPSSAYPGAILVHEGALKVWNGSAWKAVVLEL